MPQARTLLLALLAAAALVAGCTRTQVKPAPGPTRAPAPAPAPSPAPAVKPPLPALATLDTTLEGKPARINLVQPAGSEFAIEVLRQSGGAWTVAARSQGLHYKQGVGNYILQRKDLPGHPGAIVAGQAPSVFAFDAASLAALDYAKLAAPAAPGDGTQVIVDKGINILYLYKDKALVKYYHVGTGRDYAGPQPTWADYMDNYVTPVGSFVVTQRVVNPAYTSHTTGKSWPGGDSDNPLGTRWIGFPVLAAQGKQQDSGFIWAIHGTNEPDKIGTYVSDGCIRMYVPEVEELFEKVPAGSRVTVIDTFPVTR